METRRGYLPFAAAALRMIPGAGVWSLPSPSGRIGMPCGRDRVQPLPLASLMLTNVVSTLALSCVFASAAPTAAMSMLGMTGPPVRDPLREATADAHREPLRD